MESRVGFWPRLGAALIDFVIVGTIAWVLRRSVVGLFPGLTENVMDRALAKAPKQAHDFIRSMASWGIASGFLGPLYGLIEAVTGSSPGKMLLGIRIVSEAGTRAPTSQLFTRYAIKQAAAIIGLVGFLTGIEVFETLKNVTAGIWLIGCFLVFGKARQTLHDKIAATAVLRKSDLAESASAPVAG